MIQDNLASDFHPHMLDRSTSILYQVSQFLESTKGVDSVLEIGPGRGIFGAIISHLGLSYSSLDGHDGILKPTYHEFLQDFSRPVKFDAVCAFQVLEHSPLTDLEFLILKMKLLSNRYLLVSLPWSGNYMSFWMHIKLWEGVRGRFSNLKLALTLPFPSFFTRRRTRARPTSVNFLAGSPQHHWEVGDRMVTKQYLRDLFTKCNLGIVKESHNPKFPYHIFWVLEIR
jgi:hypothetical protein